MAYARQQEAWAVLCTADAEEAWRKPGRERRRESEAKPANSQKKKPGNFRVIEISSPEEDGLGVFDQRQELVQ